MEPKIISNKVYKSLQVPTENIRTTTGKVLYANKYSGIAQVAMPDDLKALIDSDFGLVGKNILIQLEQKMRGYTNGPWYVDSRDGVIYIHNRKFNEEPVTTYTYQGENGEVLRVSFSTQTITKRVKATISPTIDPTSKDLSVVSTGIDDKEDDTTPESLLIAQKPYRASIDNTQVSNYGSQEYENYRTSPTTNIAAEWAANNKAKDMAAEKAMKKRMEYHQKIAEYNSLGPTGASEAALQRKFDETSTSELRDLANQATDVLPEDKRAAVEAALKHSKGKNLEPTLKKILENEFYLFEAKDGIVVPLVEYVDPMDYDPEGYTYELGESMLNYQVPAASQRGLEVLRKDPYIEVVGEMEDDPTKWYGPKKGYGKKVKIKHLKKTSMKVPLYKFYSNLFSRYGGAEKFAWAANANANGGLKLTEKKLICQMQVVGRPMLTSSQVIILENVGKRWSGPWYIKKCTHSMDAGQGYITNLELVRNASKAGSITAKTDFPTQDIVANDAKSDSKTPMGKNKKAIGTTRNLDLHFTKNEAEYFRLKYFRNGEIALGTNGGFGSLQDFTNDLRKKCWYTDVNANDPIALAEGVIISTGNTVTSSGRLIPGKLIMKDIKVPEDYQVKFDVMEIARALMKASLKNKRK